MGAFTGVTLLGGRRENNSTSGTEPFTKSKFIDATGPASYDAGGSVFDISNVEVLAGDEFTEVWAGALVGRPTLGSDDYDFLYIPAALGAPATGLIKAISRSTGAEVVAATNLSGEVVRFKVEGN